MFLEVALIGKSVGLKGYLKLHNRSDFPEQFKKGAKFSLKSGEILEISSFIKESFQVKFLGFDDIDVAKSLTGKMLYKSIEDTRKSCRLKKDEFFYFDIIGLEVVEDSEILGVVSDILEISGSHLFEVKTSENLVNQGLSKEFYLPYNDRYKVEISLNDKKILATGAKDILESS